MRWKVHRLPANQLNQNFGDDAIFFVEILEYILVCRDSQLR